jgi:hypothetical protein
MAATVLLVGIRATFEEERGYGPGYGLNGPADNSLPCHVLFLFSIFFLFSTFYFLNKSKELYFL